MTLDNDGRDPINDEQHVVRSYYERTFNGLWTTVLVVETDLELGPRLGSQGSMDLDQLKEACVKRLRNTGVDVGEIRLVRRSPPQPD